MVSSVKIPTVDDSGDNIYTFDSPQEQLSLTKDKTDYLWYTATYDAPAANDNAILELEAGLAGGVSLMVYINGELKTTERSVSDAQVRSREDRSEITKAPCNSSLRSSH